MAEERYTFAQARARLEDIVVQVRKKDTSLEKSLDLLEEGVRLANACTELSDHTEWRSVATEQAQATVEVVDGSSAQTSDDAATTTSDDRSDGASDDVPEGASDDPRGEQPGHDEPADDEDAADREVDESVDDAGDEHGAQDDRDDSGR